MTFFLFNPSLTLVVLGGNDLKVSLHLSEVKQDCTDLYNIIRNNSPTTYIIAS